MIAVLTGDIIHSRSAKDPQLWLEPLKKFLKKLGKSPHQWEVFRGDSFQLEVAPERSLAIAFQIKAVIKSVKGLDVRIAIGIGDKSYTGQSISESTGSAFVKSGDGLEQLKRHKRTMQVSSPWERFDEDLNLILRLATVLADQWSVVSSETASAVMAQKKPSQEALAKRFGISQSSVSARYHRAHLDEIVDVLQYFRERILEQVPS